MTEQERVEAYNYDSFIPENFLPKMRFHESPKLGEKVESFPLWKESDRGETSLEEVVSSHDLTVIEFGSFT
jgi:hypothetical protein